MTVAALSAAEVPSPAPKRVVSRRRAIRRFKISLLAPLFALFALVLIPVLLLQLYFSLHQWTVYLGSWWDADFVGLDLFKEVLTDPRFGWAVMRSLAFATGSTVGCFVFGFLLAYLMHKPFRGQAIYYIIFILPMLTVPVVVAYTAEMMLYQSGPLNDVITRLSGIEFKPSWLSDPHLALMTVSLLEIWNWTPFSFIIMLAGIAAIPKAWSLFQGGPGSATETLPVYIFMTTWQYFEISKGAAMSYIVMLLMIVIVLFAIRLLRREKRSLDKMYEQTDSPKVEA